MGKKTQFLMAKFTISTMAIFHSYVNLPEGKLMVLNYKLITTVATVSKHVKKVPNSQTDKLN